MAKAAAESSMGRAAPGFEWQICAQLESWQRHGRVARLSGMDKKWTEWTWSTRRRRFYGAFGAAPEFFSRAPGPGAYWRCMLDFPVRKKRLFTKAEKKKEPKPKETFAEAVLGIAAVLVSGLFIITFIIQAFEIPSRSMEKTLLVGDHVFVDRLTASQSARYLGPLMPYRPIRRGEVAVFISPAQPDLHLVKRIIGVPGDRIHLSDGVLYVNGVKQNEPYVYHVPPHESNAYRDNFPAGSPWGSGAVPEWPIVMQQHLENGDLVVPAGNYFAMGDSRDNSFDSRYWGFVPVENFIGRPLFIYWSFDTPEDQYQRTSWGDRIQFIFHVIFHFFDLTRWSRMFHLVR